MGKVRYDPEAKTEIQEAADYEASRPGLGREFLAQMEQAIEKVAANPLLYRKINRRFRRCLVRRFPYGIIYSVEEDFIYIAAIMHLHRKPGYWEKRTKP